MSVSAAALMTSLETTLEKLEGMRFTLESMSSKAARTDRLRSVSEQLGKVLRRSESEMLATARSIVARAVSRWWSSKRFVSKRKKKRMPLRARDPNTGRLSIIVAPMKKPTAGSRQKTLNRAAAARVAAAKQRIAAAEKRAAELREELTGGGWCGAASRPKWRDTDDKIQAKIQGSRRTDQQDEEESSRMIVVEESGEQQEENPAEAVEKAEAWLQSTYSSGRGGPVPDGLAQTVRLARMALEERKKTKRTKTPSLSEAREMLRAAVARLLSGEASAEIEVERLDQLVRSHPEYAAEIAENKRVWETKQAEANAAALAVLRRAIPPDIFANTWSIQTLTEAGLPPALAKRVATKRALWLTRAPQGRVSKTHVVELRGTFDFSGLDIVETRAVYAALPAKWENDQKGEKAAWADALREKLVGLVDKTDDQLKPQEKRNSAWPENHAVTCFDPDAAPPEHLLGSAAEPSQIDDAANLRSAELDLLRAARKQQRLAAAATSANSACTPAKKYGHVVVHLSKNRSMFSRRKTPKPTRRSKRPNIPFNPTVGGANLIEQLKAKLVERNRGAEAKEKSDDQEGEAELVEENDAPQSSEDIARDRGDETEVVETQGVLAMDDLASNLQGESKLVENEAVAEDVFCEQGDEAVVVESHNLHITEELASDLRGEPNLVENQAVTEVAARDQEDGTAIVDIQVGSVIEEIDQQADAHNFEVVSTEERAFDQVGAVQSVEEGGALQTAAGVACDQQDLVHISSEISANSRKSTPPRSRAKAETILSEEQIKTAVAVETPTHMVDDVDKKAAVRDRAVIPLEDQRATLVRTGEVGLCPSTPTEEEAKSLTQRSYPDKDNSMHYEDHAAKSSIEQDAAAATREDEEPFRELNDKNERRETTDADSASRQFEDANTIEDEGEMMKGEEDRSVPYQEEEELAAPKLAEEDGVCEEDDDDEELLL